MPMYIFFIREFYFLLLQSNRSSLCIFQTWNQGFIWGKHRFIWRTWTNCSKCFPMPDSSTRTGPWIKWSLPLCQQSNMCMTLWDSILIQTCIKKRKFALQFCSAVVQGMDITVHKPHLLSSHACTREGVLEKPTLFSIYK